VWIRAAARSSAISAFSKGCCGGAQTDGGGHWHGEGRRITVARATLRLHHHSTCPLPGPA
jgi:hypothetical protein